MINPFPPADGFDAIVADELENIVAKGEIGHDEQYLLWSQCFQL